MSVLVAPVADRLRYGCLTAEIVTDVTGTSAGWLAAAAGAAAASCALADPQQARSAAAGTAARAKRRLFITWVLLRVVDLKTERHGSITWLAQA
ncbi:hypothetical protein GCM10009107_34000 [Ideonella azotifigens]|uniref:Uncharacterized protein n=1 Tax=Ideonella azotifigens TaxID=513160 RepID=A0ABN1K624_9BURK